MTLDEVRAKYPQYSDMSDEDLAKGLHAKFYSDMPFDAFASKIGISEAKITVPSETSDAQAALIAGGGYFDRLAAGLKSGARSVLGDTAVGAIDRLGSALGMADSSNLEASQAGNQAAMDRLREEHPFSTLAGELPIAVAARTPLGMATLGAIEYGTPEERAIRGGAAFAGGKAGEYIGQGIGRVLNPVRAANPVAQEETKALANRYGVELTPAQATGSRALSGLEGTLSQLPGSAGVMATRQQAQREAFNRAAMNTVGMPAETIANDARALAGQGIGKRFEGAAKDVTVALDDPLLNDLSAVEAKYMRNLSSDQKPFVRNVLDDILSAGNNIDGATYQAWRSRIGARAASTNDSEFKGALKGIQSALDAAFIRSAPAEQAALMQTARGQYRNLKTLEPLIEKASMSSSNIPPAQVLNRALVTGNTQGEMGGLAQLGQVIGKEYPNSGTVPRLFWQELLQHPLTMFRPDYLLGATGVPYLTAKAMTSKPAERYLTNGLLNVTPEIERRLMKAGALPGGLLGLLATP